MKLRLTYDIKTTTDGIFDLDVDEYAIWCIAMKHDLETALKREDLILRFLTEGLSLDDVSYRMPYGESIQDIWQATIIS